MSELDPNNEFSVAMRQASIRAELRRRGMTDAEIDAGVAGVSRGEMT